MDIQSQLEVQYENFIGKFETVAEVLTDVEERLWNLKLTHEQNGMLDTATLNALLSTLVTVRDSIEWENHRANEILGRYNQSEQGGWQCLKKH